MMLENLGDELKGILKYTNDRVQVEVHPIRQAVFRMITELTLLQRRAAAAAHSHDAPSEPELRVLITSIARHEVEIALGQVPEDEPTSQAKAAYEHAMNLKYSVLAAWPTPDHPSALPKPDHPRFRWALLPRKSGTLQFEVSRGSWVDVANLDRYNLEAAWLCADRELDGDDRDAWSDYWEAEKDKRK